MISLDAFLELETEAVALAVKAKKSPVCAFPINGTRRWFKLEHPNRFDNGLANDYLEIMWREHMRAYKLLFDHGIGTILTPMIGPDIFERDENYQKLLVPGMLWLAESLESIQFFEKHQIRVRFYGDLVRCFGQDSYERVTQSFKRLTELTAVHTGPLLLVGLCASDPSESVAQFGIEHFQTHQSPPTKREIVQAYYGEYIESVDFFIGFDRLSSFDMPLIATGHEDLYFMVAPSLYIDQHLIRTILFDHLFSRTVSEQYLPDESPKNFMEQFYRLNRHSVIGLGRRSQDGSFWYPLPQVQLPANL
ncbi:MAG: hypothetical protein AAF490_15325 [Chloroflexota bacterium]